MFEAFIYGVTLAFGLIIPLGMQNVFIFNQGATQPHYFRALPSVITAFLCDVMLILFAVLGISLVVLTIPWLAHAIYAIGILFLSYMGWVTWKSQSAIHLETTPLPTKQQIGFAATTSLLNPHALLDTIGVIGTNALQFTGMNLWAYTVACLCVSFCWFFGLSIAGHHFKKMDTNGYGMSLLNKISALVMWVLAAYLFYQLGKSLGVYLING